MLIGYGLVTNCQYRATLKQLYGFGCREVFTDDCEPNSNPREGFEEAISSLSPNDILVITQIDHLGKSADSIIRNLGVLLEKEANLQILADNLLLSLKQSSEVTLIQILVNFQQEKIQAQTQARKKTLAQNGNKIGRKPLDPKKTKLIHSLLNEGYTPKDICQYAQIGESTFYKYFSTSSKPQNSRSQKSEIGSQN